MKARPISGGIKAGLVGGAISILLVTIVQVANLTRNPTLASILWCLVFLLTVALYVGSGMLGASFAVPKSGERLTYGQAALAGVIAGALTSVVNGLASIAGGAIVYAAFGASQVPQQVFDILRLVGVPASYLTGPDARTFLAAVSFLCWVLSLIASMIMAAFGGLLFHNRTRMRSAE